jgi:hypothetical protein
MRTLILLSTILLMSALAAAQATPRSKRPPPRSLMVRELPNGESEMVIFGPGVRYIKRGVSQAEVQRLTTDFVKKNDAAIKAAAPPREKPGPRK